MAFRVTSVFSRARAALPIVAMVVTAGCGGVITKEYEYEEELYLSLDGSATVYVNASVPALVALRGLNLDMDPRARLDRNALRPLFEAPSADVRKPTLSRRNGRRFVHTRIDVENVRDLARVAPLSWSAYRFDAGGDIVQFRQTVGAPAGKPVGDVGWTGEEAVAFRIHLPSRIPFHNSPAEIQRGNILKWEQTLTDRMKGVPLELQADFERESILASTLLLFGSTIVAAAGAFALVVWWIARRGRATEMAASQPGSQP